MDPTKFEQQQLFDVQSLPMRANIQADQSKRPGCFRRVFGRLILGGVLAGLASTAGLEAADGVAYLFETTQDTHCAYNPVETLPDAEVIKELEADEAVVSQMAFAVDTISFLQITGQVHETDDPKKIDQIVQEGVFSDTNVTFRTERPEFNIGKLDIPKSIYRDYLPVDLETKKADIELFLKEMSRIPKSFLSTLRPTDFYLVHDPKTVNDDTESNSLYILGVNGHPDTIIINADFPESTAHELVHALTVMQCGTGAAGRSFGEFDDINPEGFEYAGDGLHLKKIAYRNGVTYTEYGAKNGKEDIAEIGDSLFRGDYQFMPEDRNVGLVLAKQHREIRRLNLIERNIGQYFRFLALLRPDQYFPGEIARNKDRMAYCYDDDPKLTRVITDVSIKDSQLEGWEKSLRFAQVDQIIKPEEDGGVDETFRFAHLEFDKDTDPLIEAQFAQALLRFKGTNLEVNKDNVQFWVNKRIQYGETAIVCAGLRFNYPVLEGK